MCFFDFLLEGFELVLAAGDDHGVKAEEQPALRGDQRGAHEGGRDLHGRLARWILQSIISAYDQSGWLPNWSAPGQFNCMIGNHAFSLLADGWVKGVRDFDAQKAVAAMAHDAHSEGMGVGRSGFKSYDRLGYVAFADTSD